MTTSGTDRGLRVVRPGETGGTGAADDDAGEPTTEEYWARVQALRADLAGLRPAN